MDAGQAYALVFPGQGAQREGMGRPWRDTPAWEIVADLSEWTGHDVAELLLECDAQTLRRTDLAQVAVFSASLLALRAAGPLTPAAVAGHSLGEYTALVAAGALGMRDAARLVAARGAAMRAAAAQHPGTMNVIVGEPTAVAALADTARDGGEQVWVANVNAPMQAVVSGTEAGVAAVASAAARDGMRAITIQVGGAFHSPLMSPAERDLRAALSQVTFAREHLPVVANADARPCADGSRWPGLLLRQLTGPVLWQQSVTELTGGTGCATIVEIGPGHTLTAFTRRISPGTAATAAGHPDEIAALASELAMPVTSAQ